MLRQSTDLHRSSSVGFGHSLIKKRLVMISRFSRGGRNSEFCCRCRLSPCSWRSYRLPQPRLPVRMHPSESVRAVAGPGSERSDRVYERPEVMPEFPGDAPNALMSWIAGHLKYPAEAAEKGISGTVVCRFVVSKPVGSYSPKSSRVPTGRSARKCCVCSD